MDIRDVAGEDQAMPVVVTADPELLDRILAVTAAAGVEPIVVSDPGAVRPVWSGASGVIVGVDQARQLTELVLPRRLQVYVVADDDSQADAVRWSAPLGAAVVVLPEGSGWLSSSIAEVSGLRRGHGRVVGLLGASGGVGASTLAGALAFVAAHRGQKSLLVDGDPLSGGLDLLMGAEQVAGWRWPRLATATGHLGDLAGHLPRVAGVDVLSLGRGPQPQGSGLGAASMHAVLGSARASHDLVVVDVSRDLPPPARAVLAQADLLLMVTATDLRSVAAARQLAWHLADADAAAEPRLVIRTSRPLGVDAQLVSDGLDLPVAATVADDPSVRGGVERGDPPGRVSRGPLARAARRILDAESGLAGVPRDEQGAA